MGETEIRGFASIRDLFIKRNWPYPYHYPLKESCTALELAQRLDLPADKIEAVFINYKAYAPEDGIINPGDRVGFVPYGTPGASRLLLGIKRNR